MFYKTVLFLVAFLATTLAFATASEWEQTKDDNGIKVFRRDLPDSHLVSFCGVGVVDTPVDRLLSIIVDISRNSEWLTDRGQTELLRWIKKPTDYIQYDYLDMPWPVEDRDFVSRIRINVNPKTFETRVTYTRSNIYVGDRGRIRGDLNGSYYILRPIDGGQKTLAIGVVIADPKGSLPNWIINLYQRNWPYEIIMALRKQSAKHNVEILPRLIPLYTGFHAKFDRP